MDSALNQSTMINREIESEHPEQTWGDFIQHHKRRLRMNTTHFAKHCGVGRESIYYWIRAVNCNPQIRVRRRVEEAVGELWADFSGPTDIWETNEEPFAIVLREMIEDSEIKYKVIAKKAGLSTPNLYNWCAGLCYPTLVSLVLVIEVIAPNLPATKGAIYTKLHQAMLRSM